MADSVELIVSVAKDDWKTFTEMLEFLILKRNIINDKN